MVGWGIVYSNYTHLCDGAFKMFGLEPIIVSIWPVSKTGLKQ